MEKETRPIRIEPVHTRRQLRAFLRMPNAIYRDDDVWVAPIAVLDWIEYRRGTNMVLARSPHRLFLGLRGTEVRARLIAYVDPRFVEFQKSRTGFFGAFEAANDPELVQQLFAEAAIWFREQDVHTIQGPIDPVAECWGFVIEGHRRPPVFMSPHNPVYYPGLVEAAGFRKAKDLIAYEIDMERGYEIPARFGAFSGTVAERRPQYSVRSLRPREIESEAAIILDILNRGVAENWGFVPVGEDEMQAIAGRLKYIIDPDAVVIVEDNTLPEGARAVGCAIGFPDINVILKKLNGHILPFGIFRLLFGIRHIRDYRLWGLAVLPAYQGLGLDVLMYTRLNEALRPKNIRMEANYVLEDNFKIINALQKLGMEPIKRYRVYKKTLHPIDTTGESVV